jgi:hypothetical protein
MSWAIAANWLAVAGTTLLTFGTGAQAWANLTEFMSLRDNLQEDALNAIGDVFGTMTIIAFLVNVVGTGTDDISKWRRRVPTLAVLGALVFFPRILIQLRAKGGEAVELVRFLRLAEVWTILMIGSALALAAACIQLALA